MHNWRKSRVVEYKEVTFGILLYAGTVSGRKGLKTLIFGAGVDGFVAIGDLWPCSSCILLNWERSNGSISFD